LKILVVSQYYYPEPFRISDICETLVQKGHEITVLTGLPNYTDGCVPKEYKYNKKRVELINGVKVIRSFEIGRGSNRFKLFLNYFGFTISASLKTLFMKEKFDIIFVNQLSPVTIGIPAIVYKKKHNTKILLYCLDLWPDSLVAGGIRERSIVYSIFLKVSKLIYNSADRILVTSNMFKKYFKNTLGIENGNIKYLPQYAEDLFLQSSEIQPKRDEFNFVFAGNIGALQSVETIIKAANELKNHSEIIFHIIGNGSNYDICKKLADEFDLTKVVLYGRRPINEMPHFYGIADAMLVTLKNNETLSYTLPGKVQSYMAAGKPVIGAINGETKCVIEKSGCGLCCAAEDYIGMANLILQFCNSDEKEQMASNAKKLYFENYSKEGFMTELENELINLQEEK
jgi:glycosyltransferase involved in cell wall biosynthesis